MDSINLERLLERKATFISANSLMNTDPSVFLADNDLTYLEKKKTKLLAEVLKEEDNAARTKQQLDELKENRMKLQNLKPDPSTIKMLHDLRNEKIELDLLEISSSQMQNISSEQLDRMRREIDEMKKKKKKFINF